MIEHYQGTRRSHSGEDGAEPPIGTRRYHLEATKDMKNPKPPHERHRNTVDEKSSGVSSHDEPEADEPDHRNINVALPVVLQRCEEPDEGNVDRQRGALSLVGAEVKKEDQGGNQEDAATLSPQTLRMPTTSPSRMKFMCPPFQPSWPDVTERLPAHTIPSSYPRGSVPLLLVGCRSKATGLRQPNDECGAASAAIRSSRVKHYPEGQHETRCDRGVRSSPTAPWI